MTGSITNRRELNADLADRLVDELKNHFATKNEQPNQWAVPKTNFWNKIADGTQVGEVREDGASVLVAEQRFNIHLFGGTIVPVVARTLTIPVIKEASVASYLCFALIQKPGGAL